MQPTFFPWAGYFNLAAIADVFVFLDDVQLEKQSWQTRNRILLQGKPAWISVPVMHRNLSQEIRETQVCDQYHWRSKLVRQVSQSYARHPHCSDAMQVMDMLPGIASNSLADINISIVEAFCRHLGVSPTFVRSGDLAVAGQRSERLIRICERLECDEYISPAGAADYLSEDRFTEQTSIRLTLQQYTPLSYEQPKAGEFVSHLSIIDIVSNLGWAGAAEYVRSHAANA